MIQDVLQLYEYDAATVNVIAQLESECPMILGDAEQLRQVIHNLLQNAQDATEVAHKPGAEVNNVILRTQWAAAAQRVRLVVLDQGTGFPEHILKRAFEPYVTTKSRGTGLGLAVVKKIADEHSARIDLSNRIVNGVVEGAQVSLSFATHLKVVT